MEFLSHLRNKNDNINVKISNKIKALKKTAHGKTF